MITAIIRGVLMKSKWRAIQKKPLFAMLNWSICLKKRSGIKLREPFFSYFVLYLSMSKLFWISGLAPCFWLMSRSARWDLIGCRMIRFAFLLIEIVLWHVRVNRHTRLNRRGQGSEESIGKTSDNRCQVALLVDSAISMVLKHSIA